MEGELTPVKSLGTFDPADPFDFGTFSGNPCPANLNPGRLGTGCSDVEGFVSPTDLHDVSPEALAREEVQNLGADIQIVYDWGSYSVTSISAYNTSERLTFDDTDNSPSGLLEGSFEDDFDSFSQEIRIGSATDQKANWIAGFYFNIDELNMYQQFPIRFFGPESEASTFQTKSENYSLFGEIDYALTDALDLTLGLRWTNDQRDGSGRVWFHTAMFREFNSEAYALSTETFEAANYPKIEEDWQEVSGRISLSYRPSEKIMWWGNIARGFKGGDINSGADEPGEFNISDPEFVTSFEVGVKTQLLDSTVQLNLSAYYYDYEDKQVFTEVSTPTGAVTILSNAGQLTISGVDGELTWLPTDNFAIDMSIAYIDSEFDDFQNPVTGDNQAGNTTAYTPEFSFDAIARYEWPLENGGRVSVQGDAVFSDDIFFTNANDPFVGQESYWLFGASIGYTTSDERWDARMWVKNLTDEEYFTGGFDFTFLGPYFLLPGDPRMIGATVSLNF